MNTEQLAIVVLLFLVREVMHWLAVRRWATWTDKLLDRVQAQSPGVLGELASREWTQRELDSTPLPGVKQEPWTPPEEVDVEDVEVLRDLKSDADRGAATYL